MLAARLEELRGLHNVVVSCQVLVLVGGAEVRVRGVSRGVVSRVLGVVCWYIPAWMQRGVSQCGGVEPTSRANVMATWCIGPGVVVSTISSPRPYSRSNASG